MPFDFLRRRKSGESGQQPRPKGPRPARVPFEALTEDWRLVGVIGVPGRLSDILNKREPIPIEDVKWAPIDGSDGFSAVPGLKVVDPYDLIVVLAGEETQAPLSDEQKVAHKVHKVPYDVALEAPPFRIIGTVYLYPGAEPDRLLDRSTEMFVPVVEAITLLDDKPMSDPDVDTILVNRRYLRGVEQVDKRTGEPWQKLPGAPLGGVSWQDRSR